MDGLMDGWKDGRMAGWLDDGWMDGWMDVLMDGWKFCENHLSSGIYRIERD